MTIQQMDHVGVVVDDLEAAIAVLCRPWYGAGGRGADRGAWVDRVVGLDGVRVDIAMMRTRTATAGLS